MLLKLENISKKFRIDKNTDFYALNNINCEFENGQFVSILGKSGSGKSTLLNILAGLDTPSSGKLYIEGTDTTRFKEKQWDFYRKNNIGIIFQSYNLIDHLTALENVELAMSLTGIKKQKRTQRALMLLDNVGINEKQARHLPGELSGGQKQRVSIARALANDPDIILADEPTGALDTKTGIQIMELLKNIAKDKLVIMVTHNKKIAYDYSNRVIQMKDGHIISDEMISQSTSTIKKSLLSKKNKSLPFFEALKISFRNMKKKKGRTIITAIAGSIGIAGISLVLGLGNGANIFIDNQVIKFGNSNVLTVSKFVEKDKEIKSITNIKDFDFIKDNKEVVSIRPKLANLGKWFYEDNVIDAQVNALSSDKYQDYLKEFLIGNLPKSNTNEIIINKASARSIMSLANIKESDSNYKKILNKTVKLNLNSSGYPLKQDFKIVGILDEIDLGIENIYYDYTYLNNLYKDNDFMFSSIYDLSMKDNNKFEVIIKQPQKDKIVKQWIIEKSGSKELTSSLFGSSSAGISISSFALTFQQAFSTVINIAQMVMVAFLILSLIVSSILIAIVLFSSILERKVEIGILKAIGARRKDIIRIFESEAMILGFSAGLLGVLISFALIPLANYIISKLFDYDISGLIQIPLSGNLFGITIPLLPIIVLILISVIVAFIAGYIPSRKATKMEVIDALRDE